jgi:hypothetical protein
MTPPQSSASLKTTQAARLTDIPVYALLNYVRHAIVAPPPARDGSGHFLWNEDDIARARAAWASRGPLRRGRPAA